tara:strand:- start:192 stop:1097 length:906 start_codon:yes stop_codon:yes gene_type:complete
MDNNENEIISNSNFKEVSTETFMEEVIEKSKEKPILVDFWAPWCSPCKQLGPILENAVSKTNGKLSLVKVNIDENQAIASQLQIQSIPTVYAFYQGQPADGFQGNLPESQINEFIDKIVNLSGPGKEIEEYLKALNESISTKDWDSVLEISMEILKSEAENIDANLGLIKAYVGLKQFDKAKELTNKFSEKLKNNKDIKDSIDLIDVSEKSFDASSQLGLLKEKSNKNPDDLQVNLDLSAALFGSGKISESYELLLSSIKIDPNWNDQAARKQLLQFIQTAGINSEEAKLARRKLSSILFL